MVQLDNKKIQLVRINSRNSGIYMHNNVQGRREHESVYP